jgi:NAD(P)H-quinone oxidoreductase subunit 5
MTDHDHSTTVGQIPKPSADDASLAPVVFTRLAWGLFAASLVALVARLGTDGSWTVGSLVAVDGLTVLLWVVATFFSGIVHSYSRRYMAGEAHADRFFRNIFAFTLAVLVLAAANHVVLFVAAWLTMGLVMAELIGHVRGWPQAQAAGRLARRYFVASSLLVAVAVTVLWQATGATTISGIAASAPTLSSQTTLLAVGALVLAAMIQSALLPFHTWLLSSMTAPTPASALMHAGFVNAGGILLTRFGSVFAGDVTLATAILVVGATSALLGKLLKSVQANVKRQLGCSTIGQMGFMILQVGLGFFAAAIAHLVLHGFYKAYLFLSAGDQVEHTSPADSHSRTTTLRDALAVAVTALLGGALFAGLTGKGTAVDSGLLLVLFVILTTLHAARDVLSQGELQATVRYAAVPLLVIPAIGVYALVYKAVAAQMVGLPVVTEPTALTPIHWALAAVFVAAYAAIELGAVRHSRRLYVALTNLGQPDSDTLLTSTEDYNEY